MGERLGVRSVPNGDCFGSVELKARDLGSDRGYRVRTWERRCCGRTKLVANVVGSVRLNLNPHPQKLRVRHPRAGEGIEFESGDILLA